MNDQAPLLVLDDGTWETRFTIGQHDRFLSARYHKRATEVIPRLYIDLLPPMREWLREHDPECLICRVDSSVWVAFSNENAAMMFRLAFNAEILRDTA